jgi:NAD+ synthase
MKWPENPLRIDPRETIDKITDFIQAQFEQLNRRFVFVGLSGGLDSSLTSALSVRALGKDKVRLFYLPERDSKSLHRKHAQLLAKHLEIDLRVINLSPALRILGIYRLLPLSFIPGRFLKTQLVEFGKKELLTESKGEFLSTRLSASGGPWVARANAYISSKHRLRSLLLYKEADRTNGMVIGAANRTEWLTGTFSHWGCDHCADLMPLLHLYRSQLVPLAKYLELPDEIVTKKADPDVIPGLDDKGLLLGSFEEADQILWGLENNWSSEELADKLDKELVEYIQLLMKSSAIYRETPFSLLT